MRKHTLFIRRTAVALVIVAGVAACGDKAGDSTQTATVGKGEAGSSGPLRLSGDMAVPTEQAMAASPAMSPAPPMDAVSGRMSAERNAAGPDEASQFRLGGAASASESSGAMIIRRGQASVEVRHVQDALTRIRQSAAQAGGFVANASLTSGKEERRSATLELRVPSGQFEAIVDALSALGKVETVNSTVQDVGEEYVDIGARASNARRLEARLVEMVATRTGKLSDLLTVERELARVREEIERYDARLRWLVKHTAMSTLELTLHEPFTLIDQPRPGPLAEALGLAWQRMLGFVAWCIASLGLLIPLVVVIAGGTVLVRRILREAPRDSSAGVGQA